MNQPPHSLGAAKHLLVSRGIAPEDVELAIRCLRGQFEVEEEQIAEAIMSVDFCASPVFVPR